MVICSSSLLGGAESHLLNFARKLNKKKFNLNFVCPSEGNLTSGLRNLNIEPVIIDVRKKSNFRAIPRLIRIIRNHNIDILHTHGLRAASFGHLAAKMARVPIILSTMHDLIYTHQKFSTRKARSYILLIKLTTALADKVIAVSEKVKEDLIVNGGIRANRIVTIYNGINLDEFKSSKDKYLIRKELGLDSRIPVVGIVGRLVPEKGIKYFLEAASQIKKSIIRIKFLIIGDGPLRQKLEDLAKKLNIYQDCLFTGFRKEIANIISIFDVGVLSSLCEPFGLTILEYMALGKPIVATNAGGVPEIIKDGKSGILVPPQEPEQLAQAIILLLKNRGRAEQMGLAGRALVESKFTAERMIRESEELYLGLAQKKKVFS